MTTRHFICISVGITLLLQSPILAAPPSRAARTVTVEMGDVQLQESVQLLGFGNVAPGMESKAALKITPQQTSMKIRVFCEGPYAFCRWTDRDERSDRPSAGGTLEVRFAPSQAVAEPHSLIVTDDRGKPITLVMIDYEMYDAAIATLTLRTPGLVSGMGKDWGPWYSVCAGPAPNGYTLRNDEFGVSGPDGRGCTAWVNCERVKYDNENVCWKFQVQGREAKFPDPKEEVKANASLTVRWTLVPTPPVLSRIEDENAK